MKTRIARIGTVALFVTLGMTSGSLAQNAANQVSTGRLTLVGTTALDTPTSVSTGSTDFWAKLTPDFDLTAARRASMTGRSPAGPLQVPNASPTAIANAGPGVSGFAGLTHLDQRLAGTGKYANSQFSLEPPDQGLAVGGRFVLEAVNTALAVYDKSTGVLQKGPTAINQFFKLAPEIIRSNPPVFGDFTSDPKCYFDPQTQRWFITIVQLDVDPATGNFTGRSSVLLAVSQTPDPTAGFNLFKLDTTDDGTRGTQSHPGCPCFGDQPLIGADRNGFYISTNEFPLFVNGFNGAQIYAMSKQALAAGTLPTVVHLSGLPLAEGIAFTIQPATSPKGGEDQGDDGSGVEFFLSDLDFTGTLDNRIAVWALTNTRSLAAPTPNVHLAKVILTSEVYGQPPDARQKAGPTPLGTLLGQPLELLASNDDRMNQVVFADGKLWSGVNTVLRTGGETHVGIAFFVVEPSSDDGKLKAKIKNQGYVAVRGEDVIFPSIGVNGDGIGAMTFTLSGPDFFPSAAFVRMTEEGAGTVRIAGAGASPEDGFTGYAAFGGNGTARWGDYSAAVADADGSIWMATEFIPNKPRTLLANWGTFIARIRADDSED
jgi:hypothetical protein